MGDDPAVNGSHSTSYWFDACEDDRLVGIDFGSAADFDPSLLPAFDNGCDDGFLSEIDRILESINSEQNPAPPHPPPPPQPKIEDSKEEVAAAENSAVVNCTVNGKVESLDSSKRGNSVSKRDGSSLNGHWRNGKRMKEERGGRHNWRRFARDRGEDCGDRRRRDGDWGRKRERDGGGDRRESRGYWERDNKSGKVVFRVGSWESEYDREGKRAKQDSLERSRANSEKKAEEEEEEEERKEKPVEEQVRQYQLEVLEQAKRRNTIAFLETGAGKTLIAVLLIKSISEQLLKESRKMLAIFLVPKVPLVYQQAEVIRERTGYRVGHYCGEMGQDFWDARRWQREFESKQVFLAKRTVQSRSGILRAN